MSEQEPIAAREMDLGEFLEASLLPRSHAARIEYAVLNEIRNHPGRQWWGVTKRKLKRAFHIGRR